MPTTRFGGRLMTGTTTTESTEAAEKLAGKESTDVVERLTKLVSPARFNHWYKNREYQRNIREGQHYFNSPRSVKSPDQHSPSSLLQCSRKTAYKQQIAPEEESDPIGIFWIGSRFESDIVVPFLEDVVGDSEYVTNSLWVDYTVNTDAGKICIKGETDPVVVTADADPIILTEIKTTRSVENLDKPKPHHKAQTHAYLKGLSEKYDRKITDAIILYGSRSTFDIKTFKIEFDPYFWRNTVLSWAGSHTEYRLNNDLPPGTPEYGWECNFCSYRERCGKGNSKFENIGATGLLPGFTGYPREKVVEYLKAHDGSKLTPSLAHHYPDLAVEYDVFDWKCRGCGETVPWDAVDWDSDNSSSPSCSACDKPKPVSLLVGPAPAEQRTGGKHDQ